MSDQSRPPWQPPPPPGPQQQWPQQPQGTQQPQGPWQQGPGPQGGPWQQGVPPNGGQPQSGGGPPYFGQPPRRSRAPLVAGIVAVVIVIALAVGLFAFLGSGLGPLLSRTALQDLAVGQCFNGGRAPVDSGSTLLFGVDVVACTEPHTSELAATFDYPGSGPSVPFPGLDTVENYAEGECIDRFAEYVGLSFNASVFGVTYVYPLETNWRLGDYSIQCVLHPPDGQEQASESFRNARR